VPIIIENAEVVSKSYPDFWEDLKFLDFSITELAITNVYGVNTCSFATL
jgi:3-phosphoshikimate 1-carboxyvinyltransferase